MYIYISIYIFSYISFFFSLPHFLSLPSAVFLKSISSLRRPPTEDSRLRSEFIETKNYFKLPSGLRLSNDPTTKRYLSNLLNYTERIVHSRYSISNVFTIDPSIEISLKNIYTKLRKIQYRLIYYLFI